MAWIPQRDQWTGPACIENEEMILRVSRFLPWEFYEALPIVFWLCLAVVETWVFVAASTSAAYLLLAVELILLPPVVYFLAGYTSLGQARRLIESGALEELAAAPIEAGALICALSLRPMRILALSRLADTVVILVVCPAISYAAGFPLSLWAAPLILFQIFLRLGLLNRIEAMGAAFARRLALCGEWDLAMLRLIADGADAFWKVVMGPLALLLCLFLLVIPILGVILVLLLLPMSVMWLKWHFRETAERCIWWTVETSPFWRLRAREESEAAPPGGLRTSWPESEELLLRLYQQSDNAAMPRWLRHSLDWEKER